MNKHFFVLLVSIVFVFACSQSEKTEKTDDKEKKDTVDKSNTGKKPRVLEMVKTSELATLMRLMEEEMKSAKISIEGGFSFHDSLTFAYDNIHTALPTEDNMKSEKFDGFANAYLKQLEIFRNSKGKEQGENYNLLVTSCLNCHAVHCPGPVAKIKELRIKN